MIRQSKQHLAAAGEGDGEHLGLATLAGLLAITAGLAWLVSVRIPALGTPTHATITARLQYCFAERRLIEQVIQQSSGAIIFVAVLLMIGAVAAAPIIGGAGLSFVLVDRELVRALAMA